MPLINTSVPNLIQGVSQQPDATRFDGQCEEQENALSSVADGLKKRQNTRHVARLLQTAIDANSFVHFINRNASEKYVVIHDGSKLYAYNTISGVEATINGYTGGLTISAGDYLQASTPRADMKALTIADSTLLLNSSKAVAPKTTKTSELSKEALVYIAQGDYEKTYKVDVEVLDTGDTPSQTTPATLPTATVTLTRYTYSSESQNRYYRWRISGATLTSFGSNIQSNLSVNITSNLAIYSQPTILINVAGGSASSISVTNGGDLAGEGYRRQNLSIGGINHY